MIINFFHLPNQDAWTAVICKNSFGFTSSLIPVSAGITIDGNAKVKPKSTTNKFCAEQARNWTHRIGTTITKTKDKIVINHKHSLINIYLGQNSAKRWYFVWCLVKVIISFLSIWIVWMSIFITILCWHHWNQENK